MSFSTNKAVKVSLTVNAALYAHLESEAEAHGETRSGMWERVLLRGLTAGPPYPTAMEVLVTKKDR